MVDRLDRLGHNAVIGSYDQDSDIGSIGTASTHGCESLMTRGIEEGDGATVVIDHRSTDVLGNPACLTGSDIG